MVFCVSRMVVDGPAFSPPAWAGSITLATAINDAITTLAAKYLFTPWLS
jgi:hypothetical protein